MEKALRHKRDLYILIGIVLIVRIVLFPFAQTVDSDAVTRTYFSQDWLDHPHWISTGVWPPFHYYINGVFLALWNNPIYTPVVLNVILALFTLIPFYRIVQREFSEKGALLVTAIFAFAPILFRNQFMGLSETPYMFFLVFALDMLSNGLQTNRTWLIVLSGTFLSVAAGIRYEAWMIITLTALFLAVKHIKQAMIFALFAGIFPFIWLLSNYFATGDAFFSLKGNHHWTLEVMDNNANVSVEAYLRRIWFFPFSLLIAIGPIALLDATKNWWSRITKPNFLRFNFLFALLFIVFLAFFIYNSVKGTLLLHHRFTGTLVLLLLPFASYCMDSRKSGRIVFHVLLIVGLSFIYNMDNIRPVPRLKDQNIGNLVHAIPEHTEFLIVDDIGWDYTYYFQLNSGVDRKRIIAVEGAVNSPDKRNEILQVLTREEHVTCILRAGSEVSTAINEHFQLQLINESGTIAVKKK